MHQSIPAVTTPQPTRATAGHLLTLSVPGVGHSTQAFSKDEFIGKDEAFVKGWLVRQGLEKLVGVSVKVFFVNFRYFFITCKHIKVSDKVNYIPFILTKQSLTLTLREHDHFAFRIQN